MERHDTLAVGDQVPHFTIHTSDGRAVDYSTIWQSRNFLLVALPEATNAHAVADALRELDSGDTRCLVTQQPVPGLPAPGVLIADQWGEIVHIERAPTVQALSDPQELAGWIEHLRQRCPECEGEAY